MANVKYFLPFTHLFLICPFNSHLLPLLFRAVKPAYSPPEHLNSHLFAPFLPAPNTVIENSPKRENFFQDLGGVGICFWDSL